MRAFILFISILLYPLFAIDTLLPKSDRLVEGELKNGFKYTIMKNSKPKNWAELKLFIDIGSLEENETQRGLAHFIEHMAFNGTKHFKKNDIIKYFESIGVNFGSHLNAQTSYEDTTYELSLPLESDNLEKSFLILKDFASGVSFDENEFNKERGVILEEARVSNTASYRIFQKSKGLLFGDSRYLNREPIGKKEIIKSIPVEEAKEFYKTWYRPEFMHLFVVGDINETQIEQMIYRYFSDLKNISSKKRASRVIEENNKTRFLAVTDKELSYNYLKVSYLDKLENLRSVEDLKKGIIEEMAIKLFNLKAREQILKDNPKASSIYLSSDAINRNRGKYTFFVNFKDREDAKSALRELYKLIFSFQKYGFSKSDFDVIKKDMLLNNENELREYKNIYSSTLISWLVEYAKSNSIFSDKRDEYKLKKQIIKSVTLDDVNNLFRKFTNFKDRTVLFATAYNRVDISKEELLRVVDSAREDIEDLNDNRELPSRLLSEKLENREILSVDFNSEVGVYKIILENGVEIYFKESNLSKNRVSLKGFSFGGYSLYSNIDDLINAKKSSIFVNSSGVEGFSTIDISKILADKDIYTDSTIQKYIETLYGSSSSQDIESMFELLYVRMKKPTIDKRVEKNIKSILKADINKSNALPSVRFNNELMRWYYKNNPRVIIDTPELINRLNRDKMLNIYKDRFSDFNNFKFVIVGDTNLTTIKEFASKYLGNLPTKIRDESYIDRDLDYRRGKVKFFRDYNLENITDVYILYHTKQKNFNLLKDKFSLQGLRSILNIRLRELIREDKSGVYGIGVNSSVDYFTKSKDTLFYINFSCNPKRADELVESVYEQIEKIKQELISDAELNTFKKQTLISYKESIETNDYWRDSLSNSIMYNKPLERIYKTPEVVKSLKREDIKNMAKRIFREDILEARINPKRDN